MHSTDGIADDRLRAIVRGTFALTGMMAVLLVGVVGMGIRDGLRPDHPGVTLHGEPTAMLDVAPGGVIDPASVPVGMAELYHGAEAHPDAFAAVPCFCGCEQMLGHRHLLDCFVRPDGSGWEAHASGCGVCLGEAAQVLALLDEGASIDEIVPAVIERWGDPYLQSED